MTTFPATIDISERITIFGLDFVNESDPKLVANEFIDLARRRRSAIAVTPNVDIMVRLHESDSQKVRDVYTSSDYCLPDGQPIVWASRILGRGLAARLSGSTLFEFLWPLIVENDVAVTMVCANDEIVDYYEQRHKRANFYVPPMLDVDNEVELASVVDSVAKKAAFNDSRMVLLGLGHPQNAVIASEVTSIWAKYSDKPAPVFITLGASFEFLAGIKVRAPKWVQRLGMEWFFRFAQEPVRLFNRYFIRGPRFVRIVIREWQNPSVRMDRRVAEGGWIRVWSGR